MSGVAPRRATTEPGRANLAEAVRLCAGIGPFLAEMRGLYEEADRRVARGPDRCLGGGGCCKFDLFGHRLYLTAGELAILTLEPPRAKAGPSQWAGFAGAKGGNGQGKDTRGCRCPYQARGRCGAYARRPLGCRVYFCRPADPEAPGRTYEEFHSRMALLHRRFALPYLYVELTGALTEVLTERQTHRNGSAL